MAEIFKSNGSPRSRMVYVKHKRTLYLNVPILQVKISRWYHLLELYQVPCHGLPLQISRMMNPSFYKMMKAFQLNHRLSNKYHT